MLTLRTAAGLLAQANSLLSLRAIAQLMGFETVRRVASHAMRDLGIDQLVSEAHLARGPGRLRCLTATLTAHDETTVSFDAREHVRRLCVASPAASSMVVANRR